MPYNPRTPLALRGLPGLLDLSPSSPYALAPIETSEASTRARARAHTHTHTHVGVREGAMMVVVQA